MRSNYSPKPDEQQPDEARNVLWLGARREALLGESSHAAARVNLFESSLVKGWVAKVEGVNAAWSMDRKFCKGTWGYEEGWSEDRRLEFTLKEGLYEAECMLYPPVVETQGPHRLYFSYLAHRGIVLLTREQFDERLRISCDVSFGDVRGLVADAKWREAERVAHWIEDATEREQATHYVMQSQGRWEKGLPELQGSAKQITWATTLRQQALMALREYGARFPEGEGPAQEELIRAHEWLLNKTGARFWIDHRAELEGAQIWELYLMEQVEL